MSLMLSLLFDHCLILHPEQQARIKNNLPPATVGSLREKCIQQHLFATIEYIIDQPNPKNLLKELVNNIDKIYLLRDSTKHLSEKKNRFFNEPINGVEKCNPMKKLQTWQVCR